MSLLQQHRHSYYCKRNKTCHFSFPKPPSPKNLITKFDPETDVEHSKAVLKKAQKITIINNYNPSVLLAWRANMDIQFVLNAYYACVMYVASYTMKTERAMGELLKQVAAEARTDELKTQLSQNS